MADHSVTIKLSGTDSVLAAARAIRELRETLSESFDLTFEQIARIADLALRGDAVLMAEAGASADARQHAACLSIAEGAPGWERPKFSDSPATVAVRQLRQMFESMESDRNSINRRIEQFRQERDDARGQLDTCREVGEGAPGWDRLDAWSSAAIAPVRKLRRSFRQLTEESDELRKRLAEANWQLGRNGIEQV